MTPLEGLERLGLGEREASAYLALLRRGSANAHQVAKEAGLERTSVYRLVEGLVERGLATRTIVGKRLYYTAEAPSQLEQLVKKQELAFQELLPMLSALHGTKGEKPTVRYYEGADGARRVLRDTLYCRDKLRRDFVSVENLIDFIGLRAIQEHIDARAQRGIHVRSLRCIPKTAKAPERAWLLKDNPELLREVRYLEGAVEYKPLIMTYDHTVAIISSKKEGFALVVESSELSQVMKTLFDFAWNASAKVTPRTRRLR